MVHYCFHASFNNGIDPLIKFAVVTFSSHLQLQNPFLAIMRG